jgi:glutamate decarboxylase
VVVAGERMDEDSGWYALRPGELLHVDRRLAPIHRTIIDHPLSSTGAALVPPPPNPAPDATVLAIMIGRVSLMPLVHPSDPGRPGREEVSVNPVFTREPVLIPRNRIPEDELDSDIAYQVVHDELMLDGNARLNLATFVTTWMEPQAQRLMAESFDKNMIDKDEYPRTAELEQRCVRMLADLWHTTDPDHTTGCSTTGSSEACMLAGLALKRRWQHRRRAEGKPTDRPNMVMGVNVQVCWEKFANYWEVEARLVPMDGDRFHLTAEEVVKYCDENTIGVVVILGSTFDGSYEPVAEICAALDDLQHERGWDIQVHVDGASGAMIAPFCDPDLEWDFRLPRVASINTSGHKYGLVYPGVGWVVWRDVDALPSDLVFKVNYLGGDMPTFALNFSRPGAQIIAQYYNFLRLGVDGYRRVQQYCREVASTLADRIAALGPFRLITDGRELPVFAFTLASGEEGYSVFDVSAALREQGWLVPAYTFPAHREDLQVLRIVVRNGFTHDLADLLVTALEQALPRLRGQEKPQRGPEAASFSHGADAARTHDPVTTTPS